MESASKEVLIRINRRTLEGALFWGIPPLLALVIYWPGLRAWFQDDDFVWLNLVANVHSWTDLSYALFHPTIHGTWRPLGERIYFLTLQSLFGYSSALPFRIVAFLGQFAIMALISAIVLKLTRSRIAGFLAPILWIMSDKLALTMVWNSNFNYVSCGFFILAALWCLLRYTETDDGRYLVGMWVAFLLGLCALEMMVVFPIMAAIYTFGYARSYLRKILPLFVASALFAAMHLVFAPNRVGGPYKMYFDASIIGTLARYWKRALEPDLLSSFTPLPESAGIAGVVLFTSALVGYAGYQAFRRNFLPFVFLSWFFTLLLPLLPLRQHVDPYYLGLPLIGLAMLAADAFAHAWQGRISWRATAVALLGFYLFESALVAHRASWSWAHRSWMMRSMVLGVAGAHRANPDNDILLERLDDTLFWGAINYRCFLFLGFDNVYLSPGSDRDITPHPELGDVNRFIMPAATVADRKSEGRISIYAWNSDHLDQISAGSTVAAKRAALDRIDVGDQHTASRLGEGWYPIDQGFRWMRQRASVRMRAGGGAQRLHVSGYCPAPALQKGPVHMTVSVNGVAFPAASIDKADTPFDFGFPLRPGLPEEIDVVVELDRTFKVPRDERELGLAFGVFEIR